MRTFDGTVQTGISESIETAFTYHAYDARGNLTRIEDKNQNYTYHYFDDHNQRIATVDAERYLHTFEYDPAGNVVLERTYELRVPENVDLNNGLPDAGLLFGNDANKYRETKKFYDEAGLLVEEQTREILVFEHANGTSYETPTTTKQYNGKGQLVLETDPNGNSTYWYYDGVGNRIAKVDAEGYITTWGFDAFGNVNEQRLHSSKLSATALANITVDSDPHELVSELSIWNDEIETTSNSGYDSSVQRIMLTDIYGSVSAWITDDNRIRIMRDYDIYWGNPEIWTSEAFSSNNLNVSDMRLAMDEMVMS